MKCEKHPDRDGILTVDLPSIGIRRYMCLECRMAWQLGIKPERAYGTGLGRAAHQEAQESKRYADDWERGKASYREAWRK